MTLREELQINCPPEVAFDAMADVRAITEWNAGATRSEMVSEGPVGLGSEFVTVNRGQELRSTIRTYERPGRLEYDVVGKMMDVDGTFDFSSSEGGTMLVMEFEPQPKGVMKVLFPVLKPLIRRDLAKQHLRFKAYAESLVGKTS